MLPGQKVRTMKILVEKMLPRNDRVRQSSADLFGNDPQSFRSDFTERKAGVPQLLLVEQPVPGSTILPHYHSQDQFQVFIDGKGKLGAHDVGAVMLHYTNRYTGYGPIVAGDEGLSYYVLRPSFDTLVTGQYLVNQEMRDKLKSHPGPKRSVVAKPILPMSPESLQALACMTAEPLIQGMEAREAERGLNAEAICLGPNMELAGPDPAGGGGQVALVIAGAIEHAGMTYAARGCIAITRDEPALQIRALGGGAQLLLLQYPHRAAEGV